MLFEYLNRLEKDGIENVIVAKNRLMKDFDFPPYRAEEIIRSWVKGKREKERTQ